MRVSPVFGALLDELMKKSFWMIPLFVVLPALAVIPQFWEVRTYAEFRQGELSGLSITSDGELVLAPRFDMLFNTDETLIFSAVADSAGNVYLGTGHGGKVYRVDVNGNGTVLADLLELDVLALAIDAEDGLFAATSPDGKVYRIGPDGGEQVFFDPEDKYIWSLLFDERGNLLVATGGEGVIYNVAPDGSGEVFFDSEETHIITMTFDAERNLIAGGNPKGYIYRISDDGRPFVLYDSGMQEVHSLALAADGTNLRGRCEFLGSRSRATGAFDGSRGYRNPDHQRYSRSRSRGRTAASEPAGPAGIPVGEWRRQGVWGRGSRCAAECHPRGAQRRCRHDRVAVLERDDLRVAAA